MKQSQARKRRTVEESKQAFSAEPEISSQGERNADFRFGIDKNQTLSVEGEFLTPVMVPFEQNEETNLQKLIGILNKNDPK